MSNPSLLNIPYRFKPSKLYSQIPDSGLGDFVVSRSASNAATRVNAQGFIETVADNVPRLDYPLGGIANGCPALLVEPSAQNTCLQSETFQNWTYVSASASSGNAAISPSNTQTAGLFIPNSGSTGRADVACGTLSNATTYSFSCFIKTPTNSLTSVGLYLSDGGAGNGGNRWGVEVNLTNFTLTDYTLGSGSVTSKAVENYGNGWYRVRVTGQVTSGINLSSVAVIRKLTAGADTNGINGVLVWGAQVEVGSIATSYIPTTTAPITRGTETISKTGVSSLIGQPEGTIYAEINTRIYTGISSRRIISLRVDGNNLISLEIIGSNSLSLIITNGGVAVSLPYTIPSDGIYKVAAGYNNSTNGTSLYVNGNLIGTTTAVVPNLSSAIFGYGTRADGAAGTQFGDRIRAIGLFPTRLTNAQLQALTT